MLSVWKESDGYVCYGKYKEKEHKNFFRTAMVTKLFLSIFFH